MDLHPSKGFPGGSDGKASAYNEGDQSLIPGWERSPGEGNGNPLQYSCLENPMDGESWSAAVHGVAKSWTRLSDFTLHSLMTNLDSLLKSRDVTWLTKVHIVKAMVFQ